MPRTLAQIYCDCDTNWENWENWDEAMNTSSPPPQTSGQPPQPTITSIQFPEAFHNEFKKGISNLNDAKYKDLFAKMTYDMALDDFCTKKISAEWKSADLSFEQWHLKQQISTDVPNPIEFVQEINSCMNTQPPNMYMKYKGNSPLAWDAHVNDFCTQKSKALSEHKVFSAGQWLKEKEAKEKEMPSIKQLTKYSEIPEQYVKEFLGGLETLDYTTFSKCFEKMSFDDALKDFYHKRSNIYAYDFSNWINDIKSKTSVKKEQPTPSPAQKDMLTKYIAEAFDEGFESPYDLKNSAVDQIVNKAMKNGVVLPTATPSYNSGNLSLDKADRLITKLILPLVLKIITENAGVYLCGGSILRMLVTGDKNLRGHWTTSDWDLFTTETIAGKIAASYKFITLSEENYMPSGFKVRQLVHGDSKIQLISINSVSSSIFDILSTFDLTMVQIGFGICTENSAKPWTYTYDANAAHDIAHREIRLVNPNKKVSSITKKRIYKYISRGFIDRTGLVDKGMWAAAKTCPSL